MWLTMWPVTWPTEANENTRVARGTLSAITVGSSNLCTGPKFRAAAPNIVADQNFSVVLDLLIAIFNNDSSLPTFATTVLTCAGHLRIVPVPVFRVETKNTVFMTYPMHNWAPYWLFTLVYACVPHFNMWRGHKHPCSFQLRIALNLKSTRHYMGIDLVPYVKSRTSAQHNCKI